MKSLLFFPLLALRTVALYVPFFSSRSTDADDDDYSSTPKVHSNRDTPLYNHYTSSLPPCPDGVTCSSVSLSTPLPLIIWHGLGDSFENEGLLSIADLASTTIPGIFVYLIRLGADGDADRSATFFGNLTEQVSGVCETLASHPILSTAPAVNALGFSQGGQFLRAYVERCNDPPVNNLVTFGSQHNGISKFQGCKPSDWICLGAEALLRFGTWAPSVQGRLVPAQYFRDPNDREPYLEHSNFLADVNNERDVKNATYRDNLATLNRFVMYMFEEDETAIPKESAWFAEVNETSSGGNDGEKKRKVIKLQERRIYKEDWLGLRELDEKGALEFRLVEKAGHMHLSDEVLVDAFERYFKPEKTLWPGYDGEMPGMDDHATDDQDMDGASVFVETEL